jgi:hypothetical protein
MSKVSTFASAFKDCGIGGRFSKFQLVQDREWFSLIDVDTLSNSTHCFRICETFNPKAFDQISGRDAQLLIENNPEWLTYFKTAQKIVARVVKDHGVTRYEDHHVDRSENLYYLDRLHKSVFVVNNQFVMEIGPVFRIAPEIPSHVVYAYLEANGMRDLTCKDRVKVFTRYDEVVIYYRGDSIYTNLTVTQFNEVFEVA